MVHFGIFRNSAPRSWDFLLKFLLSAVGDILYRYSQTPLIAYPI